MTALFENYITGDDTQLAPFDTYWEGQTFTPSIAHTITSVKLLLYKYSGSPGTLTIAIRATDIDGKPTGANLCSGTTNGNTLPTGSPYEWREITMGAGGNLTANTKYAIIFCAANDSSNRAAWRAKVSGAYSGGQRVNSNDSGSTWLIDFPANDYMFEDWGDPIFIPSLFVLII